MAPNKQAPRKQAANVKAAPSPAPRPEKKAFCSTFFESSLRKHVKWIVAAVMFATFMIAYLTQYEHVIVFHEQHHLFLFDMDYVREMQYEYGFWWPLMEFFVQFGYYPWLGAMVWSLSFVAVYLMIYSIIRHLSGLRDLVGVSAIVPCWMFFCTVDVDLQPEAPVRAFFIVLCIWLPVFCFARFIPSKFKLTEVNSFVLSTARFWLWLFGGMAALCVLYHYLGVRFSDVGLLRFAAMAVVLLGAMMLIPEIPHKEKARKWTMRVGCIICTLAAFFLVFNYWQRKYYQPRTIEMNGRSLTFSRADVKKMRQNEKLMIQADQALRRGDWDTVLELTNKVLRNGQNHLMAYMRSLALFHRGELTTHLFDLPQRFSEQSLFFPWTADRNKAEYGGAVYEEMGALNTAIHWEFEAMVGWGETAQHLIKLSEYYIEAGKPKQARKFIRPLKKTLFYRGKAAQLEEFMAKGDVPYIYDALSGVPDSIRHWDNVNSIGADAKFILLHDPANVMARDYMLMSMLLANNVGDFYRNLRIYYPEKKDMPRCFWEALCFIRMRIGSNKMKEHGYVIPDDVDMAFRAFLAEQQKGDKAHFSPAQQQTYWYYAGYVSRYKKSILIDDVDVM